MMVSYCKSSGAAEVIPVIPYMGYARQDRSFLDGEVVTMSLIAKLFDCFGIKDLVTIDIHSLKALSYFQSNIVNLTSIPLLARYALSNLELKNAVVVSPDQGGFNRVKLFADIIKSPSLCMRKVRDRNTGQITIYDDLDLDVAGSDIIILDDMISSGGTIMKAIEILKKNKSGRIIVMCVHALSDESALDKLRKTGIFDLISTNSIPRSCSKIDLSDEISEKLSTILAK
jgi:ribose-phosphate pyrophosphokinase